MQSSKNRACVLLYALSVLAIAGSLALGTSACRRAGAPAGAMKKKAGEKVGKVVFVGKKNACDCTRRRVKKSWEALQFALKKHTQTSVKVERIAMDVEKGKVEELRGKRRFLTLPALYFLNPEGKLVAMLEGELSPDQIAAALEWE